MTEFFPGSRQPITPPAGLRNPIPDDMGKVVEIGGRPVRLFGLGDLARLLNRSPVALRKWEAARILPKPTFRRPGPRHNGVEDKRGSRRYYSEAQVLALIRIAEEEKILHDKNAQITKTAFARKALQAFKEIAGR